MGTNALDPPTVRGVAQALFVTERTTWLSIGETLGLNVWESADDLLAMLPIGLLRKLRPRHWAVLLPLIRDMAEDADREDLLAELQTVEAEKPPRRSTTRRSGK